MNGPRVVSRIWLAIFHHCHASKSFRIHKILSLPLQLHERLLLYRA
jgi:hypothetical protein